MEKIEDAQYFILHGTILKFEVWGKIKKNHLLLYVHVYVSFLLSSNANEIFMHVDKGKKVIPTLKQTCIYIDCLGDILFSQSNNILFFHYITFPSPAK